MQLVGFNFRRAIGEPLTTLIERLILSRVPAPDQSAELQALQLRQETAYFQAVVDPGAREVLTQGLLIRANALGLRGQWTLGEKEITLSLPSIEESYEGFPPERLGVRVGRVVASKHGEPILISVERFAVMFGVKPDGELGADGDWKTAADLLSDLYVMAVDVAQDFMNAVRVQGARVGDRRASTAPRHRA